jgi:iron complex transport system substrate-binding protein
LKKKILAALFCVVFYRMLPGMQISDGKIMDHTNTSIEARRYNRVVVLDPAVTETLYEIGGEDIIAAVANTTMSKIWPEEKVKELPSVGTLTKPSIEKILSFGPDLVIVNGMATGVRDRIREFGIPVLVWEANSLADILDNIRALGIISGREEKAEKLYQESLGKIERLRAKSAKEKKLRGALLISVQPLMVFPKGTLPNEILELLGVDSLGKELLGMRPIVSAEMLLTFDPDFIAGAMSIADVDSIRNGNEAIKKTRAYRNNRIFIVDSAKILRGSPRIFEAIEAFENELEAIRPL